HDWAVVELGLPGTIHAIDVDTRHFKGNAPGWVTLDSALGNEDWSEVCGRVAVEAHAVNHVELPHPVEGDRVRLNIHPDGGVARLRVWGRPDRKAAAALRMRYLNALFPQAAAGFFVTACASPAWVERMAAGRPYSDVEHVLSAAADAFDGLTEADWRDAFAAHPRIGETAGRQDSAGEALSAGEQAGMIDADGPLHEQMAELNRRYEDRFGFTYIVRAAGRSADEMMAILHRRLDNDPGAELVEAAGQQRQITMGRLRKMLCVPEEDA
ncbi:MAG TPA: 2-oxo-4-hydroxy-4-carboxy-5-ureidoimidazoline decarboxylase, partial [Acidimicrobiia bacterium]|nr:2-oxo-4-hydroxy-4-carboxy-5-ureidoimidazoline decarboxylase [Acidimicrobiia bacterium]